MNFNLVPAMRTHFPWAVFELHKGMGRMNLDEHENNEDALLYMN